MKLYVHFILQSRERSSVQCFGWHCQTDYLYTIFFPDSRRVSSVFTRLVHFMKAIQNKSTNQEERYTDCGWRHYHQSRSGLWK